jgi:hypothetical protein
MSHGAFEQAFYKYVQQIIADLQSDGWEVLGRESVDRLPSPLRSFHPDIVAVKGTEIMIGEVKSRDSSELQRLNGLADAVSKLPNTRLEVFWYGSELEKEPARERVREYARKAAELLQIGYLDAATVMVWTALEGALDYFIEDTQAPVTNTPDVSRNSWSSLSQLYSLGYIDEEDYERLSDLRKQRNAVAHFAEQRVSDYRDIQFALDIVERMITGRYISVDSMTDWYVDNHDDLPIGLSGRPIAPAGEDVRRALREHFPGVPTDDIEMAVSQIIREAPL